MFTGIVEEVGVIRQIRRGAHSSVLTIGAETVLSDLKIGDSVAVNGRVSHRHQPWKRLLHRRRHA